MPFISQFKLVRDQMPEVIKEGNGTPHYCHIEGALLRREFFQKVREEAEELEMATMSKDPGRVVDEVADLGEVVFGLFQELGFTRDEVFEAMARKARTNGRFNQGVYLLAVETEAKTE